MYSPPASLANPQSLFSVQTYLNQPVAAVLATICFMIIACSPRQWENRLEFCPELGVSKLGS